MEIEWQTIKISDDETKCKNCCAVINNSDFCGRKCERRYKTRLHPVVAYCTSCGNRFQTTLGEYRVNKKCSPECSAKKFSKSGIYSITHINIQCVFCKQFFCKKIKGKSRWCNECRSINKRIELVLERRFFDTYEAVKYFGPRHRFICKCDCGKKKFISARKLLNNTFKPCKCYDNTIDKTILTKLTVARSRAKKKGWEYDLDLDFAKNLLQSGKNLCKYCGENISLATYHIRKRIGESTASLDRVDSGKGYTKDNVVWCHIDVNRMKTNLILEEFLDWCSRIANFNGEFFYENIPYKENTNKDFKGYKGVSGKYIQLLKKSMRERNKKRKIQIQFLITAKDIWDQYEKQGGVCALSGIPIFFENITDLLYRQTASVDRIDSKQDYSIDNIQIVHKDVNRMKGVLSNQRVRELAALIQSNKANIL